MKDTMFSRTERMLGSRALYTMKQATVAVFGLGGVGSYAVEALARSGVGGLILVDADKVSESNINRQLIADHSTVGKEKTAVCAERIALISPECRVQTHTLFCDAATDFSFLDGCSYVIDAIDTVSAKLSLIEHCISHLIPVISAMGAGNKIDPSQLRVADLSETKVCPLCRIMRKELRARGIEHLKVVYSEEEPFALPEGRGENGKAVPGSMIFVPASMGLLLAKEAVCDLIKGEKA